MGTILIRPPGQRRDVALRPAASAMVWLGEGHPHETIAVPGVALGERDALVAVEMSTICRSDLDVVRGNRTAPSPLVLGHESVGRVIATGDIGMTAVDGTPIRLGDRVVWSPTVPCGMCDRCVQESTEGVADARTCRAIGEYGAERIGLHGDLTGAFGSHVQLRAGTTVVRVPESLPAAVLAPASCAAATAWAAVMRVARNRELDGAEVRIHGAGLVGLTACAMAVENGATVEVLDRDPVRRARAARFGATRLDHDPHMVIETTGSGGAEALCGVAVGGTVVLAGGDAVEEPTPVDLANVVSRQVEIVGLRRGTGADLLDAVAFLAGRGRAYPFADAVGEVRQLGAIDEALAAASAPEAPLRIGLVPGR